jgi:hypothetical protein
MNDGKKADSETGGSKDEEGRWVRWVELEKLEVAGSREGQRRGGIFKIKRSGQ